MTLETQIKDWKNLKQIARKVSLTRHPEIRKQYVSDLYNGVKDYWNKYHAKFDFCRQPR